MASKYSTGGKHPLRHGDDGRVEEIDVNCEGNVRFMNPSFINSQASISRDPNHGPVPEKDKQHGPGRGTPGTRS